MRSTPSTCNGSPGLAAAGGGVDEIFNLNELDKKPKPVYQQQPQYPTDLRKAGVGGTVLVVFLVDAQGRVLNPKVTRSADPRLNEHGDRGDPQVAVRAR